MSPRLRDVSAGPWRRPTPNITSHRCESCGLRLHRILVDAGLTEHVLCARGDDTAFDRALGGPTLRLMQGGVR